MLLYWGMFTFGFSVGAVMSFLTFAAKKPEDDAEYETDVSLSFGQNHNLSGEIKDLQNVSSSNL